MMAGSVDKRQQQRMRIIDRDGRRTKRLHGDAPLPELFMGEATGERLKIGNLPMHVDGVCHSVAQRFVIVTLVRDEIA